MYFHNKNQQFSLRSLILTKTHVLKNVKVQLKIVKTSYGFKLDIKGGYKRTQGPILKLIEVIKKTY